MKKLKVYVGGKLNDLAVDYIKNMHRMIKTAKELRELGFSVFIPCLDMIEGLVDGGFDYEDYFQNSQPWLDVADAIFLTPGWETSAGTKREIARAKENGQPVFNELSKIIKYATRNGFEVGVRAEV